MKDQHHRNSFKKFSLVIFTVTFLGLTSSWLSSCTQTIAASSDHTNIETRLDSIETKLDNQNSDTKSLIDLTSKLSDDIGLMADRILVMADKIVETEYMIVQVITNQTVAAEGAIDKATNADGSPMLDKSSLPAGTKTADLLVLNEILKGHNGSNGVLLSVAAGNNTATTTNPPNLTFTGINAGDYILLISKDGTFGGVNSSSEVINANNTLTTAWTNMLSGLGLAANSKAFFAVKTVVGGQLSAISNSLNVTVQ